MKIKSRLFLIVISMLALVSLSFSGARAGLEILPIIDGGEIGPYSNELGSLNYIACDGEHLWGMFYFRNPMNIRQIDPSTRTIGNGFQYKRYLQSIAWDGQAFIGVSYEVAWRFSPDGQEIGHFVLPAELTGTNPSVQDNNTPGGPYLWMINYYGQLTRTRLGDPLVIDAQFDLLLQMPENVFSGLAWDGQYLWSIARYRYLEQQVVKIDPVDGTIVQTYIVMLPSGYRMLSLAANCPGTSEPSLYLLASNLYYEHMYLYQLNRNGQPVQQIYMPMIAKPYIQPTSIPTGTPYPTRPPVLITPTYPPYPQP